MGRPRGRVHGADDRLPLVQCGGGAAGGSRHLRAADPLRGLLHPGVADPRVAPLGAVPVLAQVRHEPSAGHPFSPYFRSDDWSEEHTQMADDLLENNEVYPERWWVYLLVLLAITTGGRCIGMA